MPIIVSVFFFFFFFKVWNVLNDFFPVGSRLQPKMDEQGDGHHLLHWRHARFSFVWVPQRPVTIQMFLTSFKEKDS